MAKPRFRSAVLRDFFTGMGLFARGLSVWRTAPGLMFLGMVPALIVAAAILAGLITLGINLEAIAIAVTPFANDWPEPFYTGIHIVAGLAFVGVAILLIVYTFTTVTLIVGDPFYKRIWRHVEARYGAVPHNPESGFWRDLGTGIASGLRMLVPTLLVALMLFALGFIPVVGQVIVAIAGALFGGWFLTVELVGLPFEARGRGLRERRAALRGNRAMAHGFGVAAWLVFLLPLGAVIMMPAAVGGATLLARRTLGETIEQLTIEQPTIERDQTAS